LEELTSSWQLPGEYGQVGVVLVGEYAQIQLKNAPEIRDRYKKIKINPTVEAQLKYFLFVIRVLLWRQ
jgi:hypothetical protein